MRARTELACFPDPVCREGHDVQPHRWRQGAGRLEAALSPGLCLTEASLRVWLQNNLIKAQGAQSSVVRKTNGTAGSDIGGDGHPIDQVR
jgi:hypothetical protein